MSNSGTPVTVLSVACIEPHVHGKWFILGLIFNKLNSPVHNQFRFMAKGSIRLFFVKRISANWMKLIKMILCFPTLGHLRMPLTGKSGTVSSIS